MTTLLQACVAGERRVRRCHRLIPIMCGWVTGAFRCGRSPPVTALMGHWASTDGQVVYIVLLLGNRRFF